MSSSISYSIDDKDLDDAALWAVIDSAEASHSSSKARKPLALKYSHSNYQSPSTPISGRSPPPPPLRLPQNHPRHQFAASPSNLSPYHRPHKIAKRYSSEVSDSTSPLALVRTPIANAVLYKSPEAYLSPQIGRFDAKEANNDGSEVSLGSHVHRDENGVTRHCLNASFPSVSLFKDFQDAAIAILEKSDYTMISGNPFIKKSGWRKISFYFNISYEIKDKTIEFDESRNVQRAEFVVRAYMQGGRFSDGWGSCDRREKRFLKPNHDIPSTAETRAKNKACQDLLGIGECRPRANHFH